VKKKNHTLALFFITIVTILIWLYAASQNTTEEEVTINLGFQSPEGSTIRFTPDSKDIDLTLSGTKSAVNGAVKVLGSENLKLTLGLADIKEPLDLLSKLNALDSIRKTGAVVSSSNPPSITLYAQTMEYVKATVEPVWPSVEVTDNVTWEPATVMVQIPKEIRDTFDESITLEARVSDAVLEQLKPNVEYTRDAAIQFRSEHDVSDVTFEPSLVSVTFKIRSKTQKTLPQQVRVLIAGPAEDYAKYSITLPRTIVPNVTFEADTDLKDRIESGDVTVFAIVRLLSRELANGITKKRVSIFLAIMEDGSGRELKGTVANPEHRDIELKIKKSENSENSEKSEEIAE